ncbi:hypothetical protein CLM76_09310 [Vreelandella venusta]|nr:hypothetical protein CLM76_09310 [Halomonas hydrothermalis]
MADKNIPKLLAGPYTPPSVKRGDWLNDEIDGRLEVGGWTDALIPWPRRKKTGRAALILTEELARAVRNESVQAITHYWGVGQTKVWMWRKALGVDRYNEGTRSIARFGVPEDAAARGRKNAKSKESRKKMSETKQGVPAHPNTKAGLLKAAKAPKPEGWGARANEWMNASKRKKPRQ